MGRNFILSVIILTLLAFSFNNVPMSLCKADNKNAVNADVYISVPFYYQSNNYYCGPAALEMVFDYYGEDIPQLEIADVARTYPYVTYTDEMVRAVHFSNISTSLGDEMSGSITGYSARKIGYAAFERGGLTIDDLRFVLDEGNPLIVLMWWTPAKNYGHYRVVVGYNDTYIFTNDPWNKESWGGIYGGANTSMTYSTFLDLWEYSSCWGLWVHPWDIKLEVPSTVQVGDDFEVTANITYTCSLPFDTGLYAASSCNATLGLQEGIELAVGETAHHSLGFIDVGTSVLTSWQLNANATGPYNVSVTAKGIVEGSVWEHGAYSSYDYEDAVGGLAEDSILVADQTSRVHNLDNGLNYTTIQEAIDAVETLDGNTIFVDKGAFCENVVLNKALVLVGEDEESTIIDGNRSGTIVDIVVDGATISNFTIRNSGAYPYSPPDTGLRLINASNCLLTNNTIKECLHAIFMFNSSMNTLKSNRMLNNSYSLTVWGSKLCNYVNDIDITNTVNGNIIYYLINQTNLTINPLTFPNAGYLALVNSTRIIVENLVFSKAGQAILFSYTANSTIREVQVQNCYSGIFLYDSHNNFILQNILTGSWEGGILLILSKNNTISKNTVSFGDQYGILLANSSYNVIDSNEISHTEHDGIWVASSSHNVVFNNTLISNQYSAIELRYSANNNTLFSNNIANNVIGIKIELSNLNRIFHNNFVENVIGASSTSLNFWDYGYPSGGNYWSDYKGNDADHDGIGDSPYSVTPPTVPPELMQLDHYPLMGTFSSFTATSEYQIQTICNSSISIFQFNASAITFNVAGEDETAGFCRICIPTTLINPTYKIFVNATQVPYTLLPFSNSTHSYLYFTYNHSTQEVVIIPEFQSLIIIPLFITIAFAIIIFRKKHLHITLS